MHFISVLTLVPVLIQYLLAAIQQGDQVKA